MHIIRLVILFALPALTSIAQPIALPVESFTKPATNPVLKADPSFTFTDPISHATVQWQKADVFNPAAIVKDGKIFVLYRCEDNPAAGYSGRTSRLGLAESTDGIHFKKHPEPVLFPADDAFRQYDYPGGCEDPRLVQTEDGLYVVAYTSWNNKNARLSIAFSKDLLHWEKKGPALAKAYGGKFLDLWTKSASMVTHFVNGKQVLAKIKGKYWMYWGESFINLAWSENLYDWYPSVDEAGNLKHVAMPRPGKFDSHFTECGPPAVITDKGVVLLYNGKNEGGDRGDTSLPEGTYSVGQIIFDPADLTTVRERSEKCFLKPTLPHELTGQYEAGTTFAEGLVWYKKKWYLYYGTADSFVGVAVTEN
ncbi:MAG: glycoside hydrolase family 130 protein [Cyclobacteriaceae bacterium]